MQESRGASPFDTRTLSATHGHWAPAPRFLVKQGDKLRVLEDYSVCGHNKATFLSFSTMPGPPCAQSPVIGLTRWSLKMGLVKSTPPSSTQIGAGLEREACLERHGICARHTATWRGPIRTRQSRSLLFGTRSPRKPISTNNRCFHAAPHHAFTAFVGSLGHCTLSCPWVLSGHYVDDFPTVEFAALCPSTETSITRLFSILDWSLKAPFPYKEEFDALGVTVDLRSTEHQIPGERASGRMHWQHPVTGRHARCQFMVDVGSRATRITVFEETRERSTRNNQTPECKESLVKDWFVHRGRPRLIRMDPDGSNMSNEMLDTLHHDLGIHTEIIPAEAPWKLSITGVVMRLVKRTAHIYALDQGRDASCQECLLQAVMAHSRLLKYGGYTPLQLLSSDSRRSV